MEEYDENIIKRIIDHQSQLRELDPNDKLSKYLTFTPARNDYLIGYTDIFFFVYQGRYPNPLKTYAIDLRSKIEDLTQERSSVNAQ
ncbi:MAG TPA: hypothetical protein VJI75_02685 [Candidatus Nanoarchaeia archaeon]|nr:hypothetical protein [Candidatus Nanoarchaeia archaeon]